MGTRILLIEDEEKLARFVELELTYEGYAVTKALTAARAASSHRAAGLTSSSWISCSRR